MTRRVSLHRQTKETDIRLTLDLDRAEAPVLNTGLPFFDHMLNAMAFHGGFYLEVEARGDLEVDPHHLVEDTGLVLGQALSQLRDEQPAIRRYGQAVIPMDDALSEVVIDACNRPYWVFDVAWAQERAGSFDLTLLREFIIALANRGGLNLHALNRSGANGHHQAESLFKALGRALAQAYEPKAGPLPSTKGRF